VSGKKMSLANVQKGTRAHPTRLLLYGTPGVGKSSFAADAPSPIFLATRAETDELDVARWPEPPENLREFEDAMLSLVEEKHEHKTLVVDHLSWLERLVWQKVCHEGPEPASSVDEIPFGRGYKYATKEWLRLLEMFDRFQARTSMGLILLAHARSEKVANPEGDDYERWGLDLHKDAVSALYKWAPNVLFAHFDIKVRKDPSTKRNKAQGGEARFIYSQQTASHLAKTRFPLPARFPLAWEEFAAAEKLGAKVDESDPGPRAALEERIGLLGEPNAAKARAALVRPGQSIAKLASWVEGKLVEEADKRAEVEAKREIEAAKSLEEKMDPKGESPFSGPDEPLPPSGAPGKPSPSTTPDPLGDRTSTSPSGESGAPPSEPGKPQPSGATTPSGTPSSSAKPSGDSYEAAYAREQERQKASPRGLSVVEEHAMRKALEAGKTMDEARRAGEEAERLDQEKRQDVERARMGLSPLKHEEPVTGPGEARPTVASGSKPGAETNAPASPPSSEAVARGSAEVKRGEVVSEAEMAKRLGGATSTPVPSPAGQGSAIPATGLAGSSTPGSDGTRPTSVEQSGLCVRCGVALFGRPGLICAPCHEEVAAKPEHTRCPFPTCSAPVEELEDPRKTHDGEGMMLDPDEENDAREPSDEEMRAAEEKAKREAKLRCQAPDCREILDPNRKGAYGYCSLACEIAHRKALDKGKSAAPQHPADACCEVCGSGQNGKLEIRILPGKDGGAPRSKRLCPKCRQGIRTPRVEKEPQTCYLCNKPRARGRDAEGRWVHAGCLVDRSAPPSSSRPDPEAAGLVAGALGELPEGPPEGSLS